MIKIKIISHSLILFFALTNLALAQSSLVELGATEVIQGSLQSGSASSGQDLKEKLSQQIQAGSAAPVAKEAEASSGNQQKSGTEGEVSTSEAIDQIQKTLIFSDEEAANKRGAERKASLTIDRSSAQLAKPSINILVSDPKADGKNAAKEKIAYSAANAGQYEVAVEIYKQILKSDPKNNYAKFALASCYHKMMQYKQAKQIYYQLLKVEWADPKTKEELISNLISVVIEETPNEAIYMLDKMSIENPKSAYVIAGAAMAYDKINKPDNAILLLKRAINLNPKEVIYKFNLAVIYDKIGESGNALNLYQNVLTNYVSNQDIDQSIPISEVRERVEFLKNN